MPGLYDSTPTFEKVPILKVPSSQSDFALKLVAHSDLGGNSLPKPEKMEDNKSL